MRTRLNLRLLPKLIKNGVLGGSSKNFYLKDGVRKLEMNMIFPKENWELVDKGDYYIINLFNYEFNGSKLKREYTLDEQVDLQRANVNKAQERVKDQKKVVKQASSRYKPLAQRELENTENNLNKQKKHLRSLERRLKKKGIGSGN